MALLPDGRVVVSLEQAGAIAIVDPHPGETRTLDVGGLPHGLALLGGALYVTDRSTDRLRRFSTTDWREGAPVSVGAWPHAVARLPDGTLAVANAADDTLIIAEAVVPVSQVPETIAVAADGRVATAGSLGGVVHLFSRDGAPEGSHEVGGRPVRVLFAPDGDILAVALSSEAAVAMIEGGRVRRIVVGGVPDGLEFSPDGRWLYVGDDARGAVSVIDVGRGAVASRFAAGESAGAVLSVPRP
jgi:DNA-binding beta-propeller fold protein YncE